MFIVLSINSNAQCIEITSILVDACGNPEGENEMMTLKVGSASIAVNDININWPNNNFLGFCSNNLTAQKVNQLNNTIVSCGYFLEPVNTLPPNSEVLIITSENFDPTAHSYAGLEDTIYVLFQCVGNSQGHFANWVSGCDINQGNRTVAVNILNQCTDVVTYNRCELVNQNGVIGGSASLRDGALVNFDSAGNPTYLNNGCAVPFEQSNIAITFQNNGGFCLNDTISLAALIQGNGLTNLEWVSNNGVFNASNQLQTNLFDFSQAGSFYVYVSAENGCNELVKDSVLIEIIDAPSMQLYEELLNTNCTAGDIRLNVSTSPSNEILWSTGNNQSSIFPNETGWYFVQVSNDCGAVMDSIFVDLGTIPVCQVIGETITICPDESIELVAQTNLTNGYGWEGFENETSIVINQPGTYVFTAENGCGICQDSIKVDIVDMNYALSVTPTIGESPLLVNFQLNNFNYLSTTWYLDGDITQAFTAQEFQAGEYLVEIVFENTEYNCLVDTTILILVYENTDFEVPNVFTPNKDGVNDYFTVELKIESKIYAEIYNRWGNVMHKVEYQAEKNEKVILWDGLVGGTKANDGVYYYKISTINSFGKEEEKNGFFHLIAK